MWPPKEMNLTETELEEVNQRKRNRNKQPQNAPDIFQYNPIQRGQGE